MSELDSGAFGGKIKSRLCFIVQRRLPYIWAKIKQTFSMQYPNNCKYSTDHEWIRIESGNIAYVGITDHAQSELGELVYIEVESVGKTIKANGVFGTVEAVKTTSDLFMPITAKVLEFNSALADGGGNPALINEDAYGQGWIVKVEIENLNDLSSLMDSAAYQAIL
jgi:glycine cleavage system H protein